MSGDRLLAASSGALTPDVRDFLAAAMPGLAPRAPDATRDRQIAAELVRSIFGKRLVVAMMCGSRAEGGAGMLSDLDLIVVFSGEAVNERRQLLAGGIAVELAAYRDVEIASLLHQSRKSGAFGLPNMIARSRHLLGDGDRHAELVDVAEKCLAAPGPALSPSARAHMRARAVAMLVKLIAADEHHRAVLIAGRLIALLAFLIMRFERGYSNDGLDHALSALAQHDAGGADALESAFRDLLASNSRAPLIALSIAVINRLGGPVWADLRVEVPSPIASISKPAS